MEIQPLDQDETWHEDLEGIVLYWGKVSGELEFRKDLWYRSEQTAQILLFTSFWLVDFLFGKVSFPTRMWELVLRIF